MTTPASAFSILASFSLPRACASFVSNIAVSSVFPVEGGLTTSKVQKFCLNLDGWGRPRMEHSTRFFFHASCGHLEAFPTKRLAAVDCLLKVLDQCYKL